MFSRGLEIREWVFIGFCVGVSFLIVFVLSLFQGTSDDAVSEKKGVGSLIKNMKQLTDLMEQGAGGDLKETLKQRYQGLSAEEKKQADQLIQSYKENNKL
jgi:hypothetical protein